MELIQKASFTDISDIHRIEQECYPDPWPMFLFEDMLHHPQQRLFVAKQAEQVRGYISFWNMAGEVHILNICVDSKSRRQGIGKALLKFCLDFYPVDDVQCFLLEVRKGNTVAQAFYESLGFEKKYIRERYYPNGEDAIVMVHSRLK